MSKDIENTLLSLKHLVNDTVTDFLFYDREECEDWPVGEIEYLLEEGSLTVDELISYFTKALKEELKKYDK